MFVRTGSLLLCAKVRFSFEFSKNFSKNLQKSFKNVLYFKKEPNSFLFFLCLERRSKSNTMLKHLGAAVQLGVRSHL